MSDLEVRVGTVNDLDEIMRLAMQATDENAFVKPDISKLLHVIYPALERKTGIVGVIGEPGGEVLGAVVLQVGEVWYSSHKVLEEKAIYVDPRHRGSAGGRSTHTIGLARKLAEFAKMVSEQMNMPLAIGVLSNHRTAAKVRFYERIFGEPAGVYFLYNAKTGLKEEPVDESQLVKET